MKSLPRFRPASSRGFTLIELMVVMIVLGALAAVAAREYRAEQDRKLSVAMGEHITLVGKALQTYIANNTNSLSTIPTTNLTVANLKAVGSCNGSSCLTSTFSEATSWTTGYAIQVQRLGAPPYQYEALICTQNSIAFGGVSRLDMVGDAVRSIGIAGGMTYDATGANGLNGTWVRPVATYPMANAAGKLCYMVSQSLVAMDQQYLRIDGTNKMLAALQMNGNRVTGASDIDASGAITAGSSITGADLNSLGDVTMGPGATLKSAGDLSIQSGQTLYLQPQANVSGSRTILGGAGGSGNLTTTGTVSTADLKASNKVYAANDVEIAALTTRANPSSTPSVRAMLPTLVEVNSVTVSAHGESIPVPSCDQGGQPRVFVIPQTVRGQVLAGNWGGDVRAAGPLGGPWTVVALDNQNQPMPNATSPIFQGLARIFCAY